MYKEKEISYLNWKVSVPLWPICEDTWRITRLNISAFCLVFRCGGEAWSFVCLLSRLLPAEDQVLLPSQPPWNVAESHQSPNSPNITSHTCVFVCNMECEVIGLPEMHPVVCHHCIDSNGAATWRSPFKSFLTSVSNYLETKKRFDGTFDVVSADLLRQHWWLSICE